MRKFLFSLLVLCFIASPISYAYMNPDSEEYEIVFEGATQDAYETTLAVTDPTADRTLTLPNNSGTLAIDPLTYTDSLVMEGATADDYETTIAITDPTADVTVTIPNATGTVSLLGSAETFSGVKTFSADPLVTGTTPLLTIGDGGDEDAGIQVNSDTTDYYIASENSVDALIIGQGSAIGTTPAITVTGQAVQLASTLGVTGNSTLTGSATVGTTLGVTGNQTNYGTLSVNGTSALNGAVTIASGTVTSTIITASMNASSGTVVRLPIAASTAVASGATAGAIKIVNDATTDVPNCGADAANGSGGTTTVVCVSDGTNWIVV